MTFTLLIDFGKLSDGFTRGIFHTYSLGEFREYFKRFFIRFNIKNTVIWLIFITNSVS